MARVQSVIDLWSLGSAKNGSRW